MIDDEYFKTYSTQTTGNINPIIEIQGINKPKKSVRKFRNTGDRR